MTYQEAIEMMKKRKFGAAIRVHEETAQMCELAIEALEKQIPKKVDTGKSRIFGCKLCGYGMCDVYIDDELNYPIEPMFCPYCGQAIDWSVE